MKKTGNILWGIIIVALGVLFALKAFGVEIDIFFDGWWTLFIIIPSISGIIEGKKIVDSLEELAIGIVLLLCAQGIISWDIVWKLALPVFIAIIGIKMIISAIRKKKVQRISMNFKKEGRSSQSGVAIFCGTEINFDDVVFDGAELVAVFGGIECDLSKAIIDRDCVINAACVFGGIDIKVPDNVKVVSNTVCIFGGVDVIGGNKNAPYTVYIQGACIFGGIEAA